MTTRTEDRQLLGGGPQRASLRLLGPVELHADGAEVPLGGPVQRGVLTVLAIHAGQPITVDRLISDVWGEDAADRTRRSLATLVSRLRAVLEPLGAKIEHRHGAYVLLGAPLIDLVRFDQLTSVATEEESHGDPAGAITTLGHALALWNGEPFANIEAPFVADHRARLVETRRTAEERLVRLLLAVGEPDRAVALLEAIVRETPYSEQRWSLLIDALHATGRRRDALQTYQRIDRMLRDDLGIGPGPLLRAAEQRVLDDDSDEGADVDGTGGDDGARTSSTSSTGRPPVAVVGRTAELGRITRLLNRAPDDSGSRRAAPGRDALLLVGPPGIGKTALLRAAITAADGRRQVIVGTCHVGSGSITSTLLRPLVELLQHPVRDDADAAAPEAGPNGDPDDGSGDHAGGSDALDELGPEGADLRRLITPGVGFDPLLLGMLEQRILASIDTAIDALLRRGPVSITIDDVHWADPLTRRAVDVLLDRPAGRRASVLLTSRAAAAIGDEWIESLQRRGDVDVVELAPLDDAEVAVIATAAGVAADHVDAIVDAAGGLPLLAVELVTLVSDRGDTLRGEIPDRLRRVLDLRFATLPDHAGRIVRLASLERAPVPQVRVGAALGLDAFQTAELIDASVSAGAVQIDDVGRVGFTHDLIRNYFLEQMGERSVFAARAALLQAHHAAGDHIAVAHHAEQMEALTGVDAIAARDRFGYLVRGAAAALDVGATADAERWVDLALGLNQLVRSAADARGEVRGPGGDRGRDGEVVIDLTSHDAAGQPDDRRNADAAITAALEVTLGSSLVSLARFAEGRRVLFDAGAAAASVGRWDLVADALGGIGRTGQPQHGPDLEAYESLITDTLDGLADQIARQTNSGGRDVSQREGVQDTSGGHEPDEVRVGKVASLAFHLYCAREPERAAGYLQLTASAALDPALANTLEVCEFRHQVEHGAEPSACVHRSPKLQLRLRAEGDEIGATIVGMLGLVARLRAGYPITDTDIDEVAAASSALRRPDLVLATDLVRSLCATWAQPAHVADQTVTDAVGHAMSMGDPVHIVTAVAHTLSLRREQCRAAEMLPAIEALGQSFEHPSLDCFAGLCSMETGNVESAHISLDATWDGIAELDDLTWSFAPVIGLTIELAWLLDCAPPAALAERIRRALLPHSGKMLLFATVIMHLGPADRHLGRLAAMSGNYVDAERLLRSAATLSRRAGTELWARWCDVDLAAVLIRTGSAGAAEEAHDLLRHARRAAQRSGWTRLERAAIAAS